jgi:uncharacterized protein (TIGR03084 family)
MPVDLTALADDLRAETRELERLLDPLAAADWDCPTPAEGWEIRDQVSHLAYFDEQAALAATDPDRFRAGRDEAVARGEITETVAERYHSLPVGELYAWFRAARAAMLDALLALDPSTRVPWYGPDMSIASSLTARIMETWAHGQDVADALGATRAVTPALRQVAHIGVRAFPNSFVTRGLDVPEVPVFVRLQGPDGDDWTWGDDDAANRVEGNAFEFCLVATQRINVADTALRIEGPVATEWMQIAQAFAGAAGPGRPPRR